MVEHITPNDKMTVRFGHSLFYTIIILGNYEQEIRSSRERCICYS